MVEERHNTVVEGWEGRDVRFGHRLRSKRGRATYLVVLVNASASFSSIHTTATCKAWSIHHTQYFKPFSRLFAQSSYNVDDHHQISRSTTIL
jgi:hypothetical protein